MVDVNKRLTIQQGRMDEVCEKMARMETSGIVVARNSARSTFNCDKVAIEITYFIYMKFLKKVVDISLQLAEILRMAAGPSVTRTIPEEQTSFESDLIASDKTN